MQVQVWLVPPKDLFRLTDLMPVFGISRLFPDCQSHEKSHFYWSEPNHIWRVGVWIAAPVRFLQTWPSPVASASQIGFTSVFCNICNTTHNSIVKTNEKWVLGPTLINHCRAKYLYANKCFFVNYNPIIPYVNREVIHPPLADQFFMCIRRLNALCMCFQVGLYFNS